MKELFGRSLGTGDYGHLLIDHAPMLMRRFFSMSEFSQQGFEASHKDQRQLWLKATSPDQQGEASSSKSSLQNRRNFLPIPGEQRRKRGEREARVACEGRSAKK